MSSRSGTKTIFDAGLQALCALKRIRELQIDAAIDLEFFSRSSAALTYLSGAGSRVGFHTFFGEGPYRGDLMTHRLALQSLHPHQSEFSNDGGSAGPSAQQTPHI